jgi:hypothetical protein
MKPINSKKLKHLSLILVLVLTVTKLNAQDTIIKISGEKINCKVKEITESSIKYSYQGEDILNNLSKNIVLEIVFESGRVQEFNKKVVVNGIEDWEKVQLTTLESDILGLKKGEELMAKASSGWSTTNQGKMQKKAMDKLKQQAAEKGYHMVFLITTTGKGGHYGISGGAKASVTGIGYSYEDINSTKESIDNQQFIVGEKANYVSGFKSVECIITQIEGQFYSIEYVTKKGTKRTSRVTGMWLEKIN